MQTKVFEILEKIKPEIVLYKGTDLLADDILESAEIMDIVVALEDAFGFEVPPELIVPEYFLTKEAILKLAELSMEAK